jgi:type IV pilus assembly protein PilN
MIRVNLLPIKKARRRSAGRTQLLIFSLLILGQLLVFGLLHMAESSQLEDLKDEVSQNQREVKEAEKAVESAKQLEAKQSELEQQVRILDELEQKRTGPVRVLDELQAMLSPPRNEEDRHVQSRKNWNVEWDTRRLWVASFSEQEGGFEMSGSAVNADDVAEFLERLTSAEHFGDIQLDYVKAKKGGDRNTRLVDFRVTGALTYAGKSNQAQTGDGS